MQFSEEHRHYCMTCALRLAWATGTEQLGCSLSPDHQGVTQDSTEAKLPIVAEFAESFASSVPAEPEDVLHLTALDSAARKLDLGSYHVACLAHRQTFVLWRESETNVVSERVPEPIADLRVAAGFFGCLILETICQPLLRSRNRNEKARG